MVEYRHVTVPVRGDKFSVQMVEGGSGESLIFLHGEDGLTEWTPFLDRLAQHFHVYAPAHPGQGGSQGLQHLDDLWDLVIFYEELMQSLGLDRVHVIGQSYGGMLAAELAAHRPEKVSRLVLINPLGLWLSDTPIPDFFIFTLEDRAKALWFDPECDAAKTVFAQPTDPEEKMELDLSRTETLTAVGKFIWPIPDKGLTKRIHRVTMPTLLLWGDSNPLLPIKYAEAFQILLPNSSLKVIEKAGHLAQDERPEEAVEAILPFLKS
jgi:pimeloyl-ACP methyl ester carboxylesterase